MVFGLGHLAVHGACLAASAARASRRREEAVQAQAVPTQYVITVQNANGQSIVPQQHMMHHNRQYQYAPQQHPQMPPQQYQQMYCHPQHPGAPQQDTHLYQPQQQHYGQHPQLVTAAGPRQVPLQQEEEEENETMDRPPRRNPLKKILRRLKATCLCCASGNKEEDEEPMLPDSRNYH